MLSIPFHSINGNVALEQIPCYNFSESTSDIIYFPFRPKTLIYYLIRIFFFYLIKLFVHLDGWGKTQQFYFRKPVGQNVMTRRRTNRQQAYTHPNGKSSRNGNRRSELIRTKIIRILSKKPIDVCLLVFSPRPPPFLVVNLFDYFTTLYCI